GIACQRGTDPRAVSEIVVGVDMDDLVQRAELGLPEGAERRMLEAQRQALFVALDEFGHGAGTQCIGADFVDHGGRLLSGWGAGRRWPAPGVSPAFARGSIAIAARPRNAASPPSPPTPRSRPLHRASRRKPGPALLPLVPPISGSRLSPGRGTRNGRAAQRR